MPSFDTIACLTARRFESPIDPREDFAMQRTWVLAGVLIAACAITGQARAQARVEVGVLSCSARGSTGLIVTSTKYLRCRFHRPGRDEFYRGTISKFGIDIGSTKATNIGWAVLAPTANLPSGSLNGNYGGIGAEATAGYGVGANALIGGSRRSIVLQPLSVQAQKGLNIAAGVESLILRAE
jgi:hypothetical protein